MGQQLIRALPIDADGYLIHRGSRRLIQSAYRPIVREITQVYQDICGDAPVSAILRGSVAVGKARADISDLDSVAIITRRVSREITSRLQRAARRLERRYPFVSMVELQALYERSFLRDEQFTELRVNIATQSCSLVGPDAATRLPRFRPNRTLGRILTRGYASELRRLQHIFRDAGADRV